MTGSLCTVRRDSTSETSTSGWSAKRERKRKREREREKERERDGERDGESDGERKSILTMACTPDRSRA